VNNINIINIGSAYYTGSEQQQHQQQHQQQRTEKRKSLLWGKNLNKQ